MAKHLSFFQQIRSFSFPGLCRYLFLKMTGKAILVTGSCRGCGSCCRCISLEGRDGWLRSEETFQEMVSQYPEYQRFTVVGKDPQGVLLFSCTWRTAAGTCRDYQRRLPLCGKFPEASLFFAGAQLPPTCGYRFSEVVPFATILKRELGRKK